MKEKIQSQRGFTGIEIVVSIVALMIFVSLIATIFFNIYLSDTATKRYAVASSYVTQISELIDSLYYADVTESNLEQNINQMNITNGYTVTAKVTPYQQGENTKDLVKTVTISVKYLVGNNIQTIKVDKIKAKEILITPNKPKLSAGMVPVKYVESTAASGQGYWIITTEEDSTWYSYENKKWANIMLQDGLTVEGGTQVNDTNRKNLVGQKVATMGSMFVWIPRYAYKIPEQNVHTSEAAEIEIVFLYSTSDYYIDENGDRQPIRNKTGYKIHPSFQNGEKTNYANGEWDSELTGYWVAKFEASSSSSTAENGGGNVTDLNVKVLPGVTSWRAIDLNNMYTVCQKMKQANNIYHLENTTDSHLMKNSEWGAVAYLTQSKYGKNAQVWNNSNYNYITGNAGSTKDATSGTNTLAYNTDNGPQASTTGNVYGIYDMAGGADEMVAAYVNNAMAKNSSYLAQLRTAANKYKNVYSSNSNDDAQSHYETNSAKYGDALYETSAKGSNNSGWYSDGTSYPSQSRQVFSRGGKMDSGAAAGITCYSLETGNNPNYCTFRPVLTIP